MKIAMRHLLKVRVKKPQNNDCKKEKAKKGKLKVEVDKSVVDVREKTKRKKMNFSLTRHFLNRYEKSKRRKKL